MDLAVWLMTQHCDKKHDELARPWH